MRGVAPAGAPQAAAEMPRRRAVAAVASGVNLPPFTVRSAAARRPARAARALKRRQLTMPSSEAWLRVLIFRI